MLRRVLISLHKLSSSERCLLVCHPRRTVSLSSCLFGEKKENEVSSSSDSESSDSDTEKGVHVDEELQKAAESVAKAVPGKLSEVKSDLLKQLRSNALLSKKQAEGQPPPDIAAKVSNLLSGMRVTRQRQAEADKQATYSELQKERERRSTISHHRAPASQVLDEKKAKLFHGPDLGIFTADVDQKPIGSAAAAAGQPSKPDLWLELYQTQLMQAKHQPPSNAFEEMIEWTESGKLWTFPINNEQGMDEEAKVGFHQHVFLENQITDFPRRGPIRHFMELVITGLSKNPYLTVQQKHEHIDWFRQYFKENKSVLEETLGKDGIISESASTN